MTVSFTLSGVSVGSQIRRIPHSGNARLHWSARYKWNRQWKDQAGWGARAALKGAYAPGWMKAEVTITLCSLQELDQDNAHAAVKPIVDGLKGILIVDDSPEHIRLVVKQKRVSKRAEERVEVEVRAMTEDRAA